MWGACIGFFLGVAAGLVYALYVLYKYERETDN